MGHHHDARHMDGMDMSMNEFQPTNKKLARVYWYLIAGVLGLFIVVRAINFAQSWLR